MSSSPGIEAALLNTVAVRLDDESLDVADLVLLGVLLGQWQDFMARTSYALALEDERAGEVGAEDVRRAATEFRYAHGLISAADFRAWLAARDLQPRDLSGVLRRGLLLERAGRRPPPAPPHPRFGGVLRAEALCTGTLAKLADAGAERLAAARAAGTVEGAGRRAAATLAVDWDACGLAPLDAMELRRRLDRLAALDGALTTLDRRLCDPARLQGVFVERALDWLRLSGRLVTLDGEGAARELRLLVAHDALPLDDALHRASVRAHPHAFYLEEIEGQQRAALAAAVPGELVGPWADHDGWRLFLLEEKVAPTPDDPETARRALDAVRREELARHTAGRLERPLAL